MPRKAFVADLQEAIGANLSGSNNVLDLKPSDDDGSFRFTHQGPGGDSPLVEVEAQVTEVGDYPTNHSYFGYTNSDNLPKAVVEALEDFSVFDGMTVPSMISKLVKTLNKATAGSRLHPVELDEDAMDIDSPEVSEDDDEEEEEGNEGYADYDEYDGFSPNHHSQNPATTRPIDTLHSHSTTASEYNSRIRADLRLAKNAGFRIGYLGSLLNHGQDCYVTLSCRVSKLGIPEEALQAWHLDRKQYVTLIIHYTAGYRTMERLNGDDPSQTRLRVEMRVGMSQRYKVTLEEAVESFSQIKDRERKRENSLKLESGVSVKLESGADENEPFDIGGGLHGLFISRPLNELLNERLLSLLRYRIGLGISWSGAEAYYNDNQGRNQNDSDAMDNKYFRPEDHTQFADHLPKLITYDHLAESYAGDISNLSFPLLAMQYTLRHLVLCTEFCLVCHCKIEASFEALKPYVCDKPLCLYQYMTLGFGPSIEYEILSQPDVVDLLVSFCYSSASAHKLKSLPIGMGLMVPAPSLLPPRHIASTVRHYYPAPTIDPRVPPNPSTLESLTARRRKASYDRRTFELIFKQDEKPLRTGDWIVLIIPGGKQEERQHRRVTEVLYPTVRLGPPICSNAMSPSNNQQHVYSLSAPLGAPLGTYNAQAMTPAATPPPMAKVDYPNIDPSFYQDVEYIIYDQLFDELTDIGKLASILSLLDTLPSIHQMRDFLGAAGRKQMSLREWSDRISPAALGVLRWIIASNRSCIIQGDSLNGSLSRQEDRVAGMDSYLQFRFAQGAPDKEQRFITSVRDTTARLGLQYPTMFAWHGSPLENWHGIVREGLHFKDTLHGRAFGNGVYHSLDASTSLGYTNTYAQYSQYDSGGYSGWPQSHLKITQALSLNEIVNAPQEFVSKAPHLVVAQLDWIQTRYLFVKSNIQEIPKVEKIPTQAFEQDPTFRPSGPTNQKIIIPITAVSKSRRPASKSIKIGSKRSKVASLAGDEQETLLSDDTDIEDVEVLFSEAEEADGKENVRPSQTSGNTGKGNSVMLSMGKNMFDSSKTDFLPGSLDHTTLPLLEAPSYATTQATKSLHSALKAMIKTQETHPAHELGWYIDPELVGNVYQWIVELHSFESHLPLASDMKGKGLKSIVLEVRFGKEYPYSPPFVRVIRPRFLPFMQGGGGHVTAGGALCMELLTNNGWSAVSSIESVLLQVRLAISSTDPKPARLERGPVRGYDINEAIEAFQRACRAHGWKIPDDLKSINPGAGRAF